jgi:hypothetical protein
VPISIIVAGRGFPNISRRKYAMSIRKDIFVESLQSSMKNCNAMSSICTIVISCRTVWAPSKQDGNASRYGWDPWELRTISRDYFRLCFWPVPNLMAWGVRRIQQLSCVFIVSAGVSKGIHACGDIGIRCFSISGSGVGSLRSLLELGVVFSFCTLPALVRCSNIYTLDYTSFSEG